MAQLILPDDGDEVEELQDNSIFVPGPERTEGLHASDDTPDMTTGTGAAAGELELRPDNLMLQRMQANQIVHHGFGQLRGQGKVLTDPPAAHETAGPTNLVLRIARSMGESSFVRVKNQPLTLESQIGKLVVPMHEVRTLQHEPVSGRARVETVEGDVVEGTLKNLRLRVRPVSGDDQFIPFKVIRRLEPDASTGL